LKLLFILESFFPSHRAGTEVYVLNLCKTFIKSGWDVSVLIATSSGLQDYKYEDIPVYTFPIPKKANVKALNGLKAPEGLEKFKARVREIQPDIAHFHSFGRAINSYHLKAVNEMGIKTAFTPHLGSFFCTKGDMRLFSKENCDGKIIPSRCLACVANSQGLSLKKAKFFGKLISLLILFKLPFIPAAYYRAHFRKIEQVFVHKYADLVFSIAPWIQKAFTLNGVAATEIPQPISEAFTLKPDAKELDTTKEIQFAFVGRIHSSKGLHILAKAWFKVASSNKHLHIITGTNVSDDVYYQEHVKWSANRRDITWVSGLNQRALASYLDKIDVLILPSIVNEVSPLAFLEAAAKGIPIIGTDILALETVLKHEVNGLKFPLGNADALASYMTEIIEKPSLIKAFAKHLPSPKRTKDVASVIEQHYNKILSA